MVNLGVLFTGIGGQDGAYLALLLANKGYQVLGTSRDAGVSRFDSLARLGVAGQVSLLLMAPHDFKFFSDCNGLWGKAILVT